MEYVHTKKKLITKFAWESQYISSICFLANLKCIPNGNKLDVSVKLVPFISPELHLKHFNMFLKNHFLTDDPGGCAKITWNNLEIHAGPSQRKEANTFGQRKQQNLRRRARKKGGKRCSWKNLPLKVLCCPAIAFFFLKNLHVKPMQCFTYLFSFPH